MVRSSENIHCFSRGAEFDPKHPQQGSAHNSSSTPVTPTSGLGRHLIHVHVLSYTHTHKVTQCKTKILKLVIEYELQ